MEDSQVTIVSNDVKAAFMNYLFMVLSGVMLLVVCLVVYIIWSVISYVIWVLVAFATLWIIGTSYHYYKKAALARQSLVLDLSLKSETLKQEHQQTLILQMEVQSKLIQNMLAAREMNMLRADENGVFPILLKPDEDIRPLSFTSPLAIEGPTSGKEQTTPAKPAAYIPTARQLIDEGMLRPWEKESVLAYRDGQAEIGRWNQNYSFMVYGGSGSGKSSLVSYYTLLAIYHGARILAIDPESELKDSLTSRLKAASRHMLSPIGDTVEGARRVLSLARQELESPGEYPVMFLVDEYSTLMRKYAEYDPKSGKGDLWGSIGDELTSLLEEYGQRGRKRGRVAIAIGQLATASRTGGTEVKNSMTALFVMRVPVQTARLLMSGQGKQIIQECTTLLPGEAQVLFTNAPQPIKAAFPYVDPKNNDMEYALEKLYQYEHGMRQSGYSLEWTQVDDCMCLVWRQAERTTVHTVQDVHTAHTLPINNVHTVHAVHTSLMNSSENHERTISEPRVNARTSGSLSARADRKRRIQALLASGIRNKAKIIGEVYHATKGGTERWKRAEREYDELVKELKAETSITIVESGQ